MKKRTDKRTDKLLALLLSCSLALGTIPVPSLAYAADSLESTNPSNISTIEAASANGEGEQATNNALQAQNQGEQLEEPKNGQALTGEDEKDETDEIDSIISEMTLDEKISQMIMIAIRTWDKDKVGEDKANVTDLAAVPDLAAALKKHQYGGIILFGQNITGNEQVANLVQQLQANNDVPGVSRRIPYFMAVDEEGGIVIRFAGGTRMTGSMAIGATGTNALKNAKTTGEILGSEVKALGFNVNFAPSLDVNNNPSNPAIGTRSFSDDPDTVAKLGTAWIEGHSSSGAIATLKHFPGDGDTGEDAHFQTASVNKTYEQLNACELVPFRATADTADMIMTAHITLPLYDDEQTFADGTKGYYPATMSPKVVTDLLRGELGYDGVVVTDALEMEAITELRKAVGGDSVEAQDANIAEKIINAGSDILLIPTDLDDAAAVAYYDKYIKLIEDKVKTDANPEGTIDEARIDESVRRILKLKQKYGFLDEATPKGDIESVGSVEHHTKEMEIARESITLVKNDNYTLPASGLNTKVVLVGRNVGDNVALDYAVKNLQAEGLIPENAYVKNLAAGTTRGDASSSTKLTIDYTFDNSEKEHKVHYTDELKAAISEANLVVGVAKTYTLTALKEGEPQYEAIHQPLEDAHAAGAKFVFISDNLPYDVARHQSADAIIAAYLGTGTDIDPTTVKDGSATIGAFNANLVAAVESVFDHMPPSGTLPVNVPVIKEAEDKSLSYSDEILYERGFGLKYVYLFTEGANGTHQVGSKDDLAFKNNARYNKLTAVRVDGKTVDSANYTASAGSTNIGLKAAYLDTLEAGGHTLETAYDYGIGKGEFTVSTKFDVTKKDSGTPATPTNTTPANNTTTSTTTRTTTPTTSTTTRTTTPATSTTTTTKSATASTGDSTSNVGVVVLVVSAAVVLGLAAFVRTRRHA